MNHTNKLLHYMRVGMDGAGWYDNIWPRIQQQYPAHAVLFSNILAVTSPNATVKGNVYLARKAYAQHMAGKDFVGFLPVVVSMLRRVVAGEEAGGLKVRNFARALRGDLDAVVVDRWMSRAFGFGDKNITPKRYRDIESWIRVRANKEGMMAAQVQAAVWCGIKRLEDTSGAKEYPIDFYL